MTQPEMKYVSPEDYFSAEESSESKHEYWRGEVFAMSGASHNHNIIAGNIFAALHSALKNSDCVMYIGDMKVRVEEKKHYAYPDISVARGPVEFADNRTDIIANPVLIFEVLSESTKDYDRGGKFKAYRNIASLRDYILVDQYAFAIEYFFKNDLGKWELDEFEDVKDTIKIRSLNVELSLRDVYHRIIL